VRSFFAGRRLQHRWRGRETNLLFFTKGTPTERIWYYDLSDVKVGKKSPLTLKHSVLACITADVRDLKSTGRLHDEDLHGVARFESGVPSSHFDFSVGTGGVY
jgi:hypothetical protein